MKIKNELEESIIAEQNVELLNHNVNEENEIYDDFDFKSILKKTKLNVQNEFNFDNPENLKNGIPKYKDLKYEIETEKVKYNRDFINLFRLYDGLPEVPNIFKGMIVNGYITDINQKEIVVNIGNKDNITIDRKGSEDKICKKFNIGNEIDVLVTKISNNPFYIKGSIEELVKYKVEEKMKKIFDENIAIEAYVKELIPAGFILSIDMDNITVDAFMPNTLADVNKLHDNNSILGQKILVMLETLQQDKGIYVVSRKKYLKTLIPDKIKYIKKQPKDKVYTGHVTGTKDFGIFVQFENCLTGMIHKANIREDFRDKIKDIKPGTEIDFYVKDIVKGGQQIICTQFLQESLWDTIRVGDDIKGKIFSIKPFGALIELDFETNGLIQTTYINKNNKTLKVNDIIDVVVISIIRDERKIYLTFSDDIDTVNKLKEKFDDVERLKMKYSKE